MQAQEKAIAAGVNLRPEMEEDFRYSMSELGQLAAACDIRVLGEVTQNLKRIHPATYMGKGKIQEISALLQAYEADLVLFNDELSPSQIRNLEKALDARVIDRTMLILEIFSRRAKTKEAKLQVEVAQLEYMQSRLVGQGISLNQQTGGVGTISRGGGETQLELDRRKIATRISHLNRELERLVLQRQTQRQQRRKTGIPVVSLVGYTNAGKSSLMNRLVAAFHPDPLKQVFEEDMLFATLQTAVRHIRLPDNRSFLLTDTVGFIDKLPHHLVKAFRSTLEEVAESRLLIHVVDLSHPRHQQHMAVTEQTLKEIGAGQVPVIYAYNKIDLAKEQLPAGTGEAAFVSAKTGQGVEKLVEMIKSRLFSEYTVCTMRIPFTQGWLLSYFSQHAAILNREYDSSGTLLTMECRISDYEKYREYVVQRAT